MRSWHRIAHLLVFTGMLFAPTLFWPVHVNATSPAAPAPYVFPFSSVPVNYPTDHLHYPAVDVEGCYAHVLAPTAGIITQIRTIDKWVKAIDAPGTRGGKTITLVGDDHVRYFFAHLGRVKVAKDQRVVAGDWIGVMGSTGNARVTRCHTHLGISRVCPIVEAFLLQGEIWPQKYLKAWRDGQQLSPAQEIKKLIKKDPLGCERSRAETRAAENRDAG
ncbi:MAG: M23 family metallopeptidase [Actinobacteria bacterium]|nr:MAG: M23 family metallopeptidase [Actinomycetota bacterium]